MESVSMNKDMVILYLLIIIYGLTVVISKIGG